MNRVSVMGACLIVISLQAKVLDNTQLSVKQQLSQMIEDQLADLDVAINHAKKSHENFQKEDAEYMAAKNVSSNESFLATDFETNIQIKNIIDPSNLRSLNGLLPLKNEITTLDFYKQVPRSKPIKSKKRELWEKNNARIDRYVCGMSMIDEKMEKLDHEIKKIQTLAKNNELLPDELEATNRLIEVKRKHKAQLKEHKNAMKKAVTYLKKHRSDLD